MLSILSRCVIRSTVNHRVEIVHSYADFTRLTLNEARNAVVANAMTVGDFVRFNSKS